MASSIDWVSQRIKENENIKSLKIDGDILKIDRKKGESLNVSVISFNRLTSKDVEHIDTSEIDFVLNIPKDAFISGSVINSLEYRNVAVGGLGDLHRVLNQEFNWPYQNPGVEFIMRGLEQHRKVTAVRRLDSKRYEIDRIALSTVTILALNDYELSAEAVRNGKQVYGEFHSILASHPYARISTSAHSVASGLGINIHTWRELLGKLNLKWI